MADDLKTESSTLNALRQWFKTPIGEVYRHKEAELLHAALKKNFRREVLQIDRVGWENEFFDAVKLSHFTIVDNQFDDSLHHTDVIANNDQLPIDTHSVDIVIMPHTLEFEKDPHQVLREVNRVLRAEGIVLLTGFNPWAFWHWPRFLPVMSSKTPWNGRFISRYRVVDWLKLLNFEIEANKGCCVLPVSRFQAESRLGKQIEKSAAWIPLFPAAYFIMGVKRVAGATAVFQFENLKDRLMRPLVKPVTSSIHAKKDRSNIH